MVKSESYKLDLIFHALSDQTRRSILTEVAAGGNTVGELAKPYKMSLAAVSKHLKVLESAGLIERQKTGSFQMVHFRPQALKTANQWISFYEKFWDQNLNALKELLEKRKK